MDLTIGAAARRAGCTAPTIRFYESIGLISPAVRTAAGRRSYGASDIRRLQFIRRARDFGMSIPQVRELLAATAAPDRACVAARDVVRQRLADVRERKAELDRLESDLQAMAARCDEGCGAGAAAGCSILDEVAGEAAAVISQMSRR